MSILFRASLTIVFSVAIAGCATMNVSSQVQRGIDFSGYHTYEWAPPDALPVGDARLDRDPFFRDHMQGAVDKQLTARGLERSTSRRPDLLAHYHVAITRRIDVNCVDRQYGYASDDDMPGRVIEYEVGTLIIDLVDSRTNRVVWRGWAQQDFERALKKHDFLARTINTAVTRMFQRLPRPL